MKSKVNKSKVKAWLNQYEISNFTIRSDGIVDVDDDVDLTGFDEPILPVQFGKVSGSFNCYGSALISLQGTPQTVGGDFDCHCTLVTSLQGSPRFIGGSFDCYSTKIKSLDGAPASVGGGFYCDDNNIVTLHGIHKTILYLGSGFYCTGTEVHLLGLLLIKGVVKFDIDSNGPIDKIFNKYVGTGDILSAQDELIDAGFIEQARL